MKEVRYTQAQLHDQLVHIAKTYTNATGVQCQVMEVNSLAVAPQFCPLRETETTQDSECFSVHQRASQLSEYYGGAYIYFCPHSLVYWNSPILYEGMMRASLICGPVLVVEPREWLEEQLPHFSPSLMEVVKNIPYVSTQQVHHLSEMLRIVASWGSGENPEILRKKRETLDLMSRISEHIHEQKGLSDNVRLDKSCQTEQEHQLQEAISWGDKKRAQAIMNELLGEIFMTKDASLERVKYRVFELMIILSRAAIQGGAPHEEINEISFTSQKEIHLQQSMEGIVRWLSTILHQYTNLVFETRNKVYGVTLSHALQYMRAHYQQRLTLEDVAQVVSLSPNYFSHLFNETMNTSFTTYLNRLRIEHAMRLLTTTRLYIVEIAGVVGFDDHSYFTKKFTSTVGISPSQYRKQVSRFPSENHEIHSPA
jgi:two-component system response regulator YesN